MHSRRSRTGTLLCAAAALTVGLSGCGTSDSTATSGESSSSTLSTAGTSVSTAPSTATATSVDPAAPTSTDPNAESVPGPQLPPATAVPASKQGPAIAGARCGTANGPEGALRVVIFPGGTASCGVVMPVATKYGPLISTGRAQSVDGWNCGPSQVAGVLASCVRGSESFGFVPQ